MHDDFLQQAIDEAVRGVEAGRGGPFGAVIVRGEVVLARGHNCVTSECDPTAHAEIVAIRAACRAAGDHALRGAVLYASTEPCPMCLSAIYWARLDRVYYAATRDDAAAAGFDDAVLYHELALPADQRTLPLDRLDHSAAQAPFDAWAARAERTPY